MQIALAEALLKRKELGFKLGQLQQIKNSEIIETKFERRSISDSVDDITAKVPKISMTQLTHAFDWHAKHLRKIDAVIQKANWNTIVEVDDETMQTYVDPYVEDKKR